MIYSTAEYVGMGVLLLAVIGAGVALMRLDSALARDSASSDDDVEVSEAMVGEEPPFVTPAPAHRGSASRRARRKHGR